MYHSERITELILHCTGKNLVSDVPIRMTVLILDTSKLMLLLIKFVRLLK